MSIVTTDEISAYSGKVYPSGSTMLELARDHADEVIENYLGYNPISETHTDSLFSGTGKNYLSLDAQPISSITKVEFDFTEYSAAAFAVVGNAPWKIYSEDYIFPKGLNNIRITFVAGYAALSLPVTFKTVALIIATLFLSGEGGGITVRSRQAPGGQTEFVSRNYAPHLKALDKYRIP